MPNLSPSAHDPGSKPARFAALIDEVGYLFPAFVELVLESRPLPSSEEQFGRVWPSLAAQLNTSLPADPDEARGLLLDELEGFDEIPHEVLHELGFEPPERVLTVHSGTRWHSVDLGVLRGPNQDWWWAWLDSNVSGEYHRVVASRVEKAAPSRRSVILRFLAGASDWILEPARITTALRAADVAWLSGAQPLPTSATEFHGPALRAIETD